MNGPAVSFRGSVHEYIEKFATSAATALTTTATDISPSQNAIISYGFMRRLKLRLRNSVAANTGNFNVDYPAKLLSNVKVVDPNGAEVYGGPTWSGYETYLAEKYGAYKAVNDPSLSTLYSNSATTPLFQWTIPFEMAESSGLGSLPNFDAQSPYQITCVVDTLANAYLTAPTTTNPTILLDYILEAWTVPDQVNRQSGVQQTLFPPGIGQNLWGVQGVGCTVQHWTLSNPGVTASTAMAARLIRKGNIFRNLVLVVRNSSNARVALSNMPNPITFMLDGAPLWNNIDPAVMLELWFRREVGQAGSTNVSSDTGVLPVMFANPDAINIQGADGTLGMQGMLGTNEASRLEFSGTWGSSASVLQCLTNDVNGVSLEGSPYAWSYARQLQSPVQSSVRSG